MSSELTVLNNNTPLISKGGLGIDRSSHLLELKPATLTINQPNSQGDGLKKGYLRILTTGDQFEELDCVFLGTPTESRSYYAGNKEELNRTPENLLCFSTDLKVPHDKAKVPQAVTCGSCARQDWTAWREYKEQNGQPNKALIPPCEKHIKATILSTKHGLPLNIYVRGKSMESFKTGLEQLVNTIVMAEAKGLNPNIFDIRFKLGTKQITTGKFVSYIFTLSKFDLVLPEERAQFGEIYLKILK